MAAQPLASLSLVNSTNEPEQFARKVVVIPYVLMASESDQLSPHFLLSVISPKQKHKSLDSWQAARKFRLPSGHSLIKGTREMIFAGQRLDVPPGFGRYFSPRAWNRDLKINQQHHEIIARIDGLMPAVSTALNEAREEGGIKPSNIRQLIDLGVIHCRLDGRPGDYHVFAMELAEKKNARAKDSLAVNYFSYQVLKQARKIRFRYNIPLVRPSHFRLIKQVRKSIQNLYQSRGVKLYYKAPISMQEQRNLGQVQEQFKTILNKAAKGKFVAHQCSLEQTIKRIIKRSVNSRKKVKRLKKLSRKNV